MKKFIFILGMSLTFFCLNTMQAQHEQDEKAIKELVQEMADAWTNGDGKAFSEVFAEQHSFVVWFGMYFPEITKEMNAHSHQIIFDGMYKNTKQYAVVDHIQFVRDDIAIIHTLAGLAQNKGAKPEFPEVLWSGVLEKINGEWKIISFHNLDLEILLDENLQKSSPMPMDVMFKSWKA